MIPVRIELEGFLCYRDKQVIDLDGYELWVFSGRNGSGKSAVFDAMTYALFKAHRGGKSGAANLIHSDADGFSVLFEFDLGGERYRLRRSLRKTGRAERQLFVRSRKEGEELWPAVPESDTDAGLEDWIARNVGLNFETFTASVLLMQGRADCLLNSQPKERHAILAGIVDLARYQDLHRLADRRRVERKARLESLQAQLRTLPEIGDAAIGDAELQAGAAEQAHAVAETAWKAAVEAESQARIWRGLVAERGAVVSRRNHARKILEESEAIARDWRRLQELAAILGPLRQALDRRARIEEAEAHARRWQAERDDAGRKLDLLAAVAEDNLRLLDAASAEIARDDARRSEITAEGLTLAEAVGRARTARGHRDEIQRLTGSLASHAEDLPSRVDLLENKFKHQQGWAVALPSLRHFARDRDALRSSRAAAAGAMRTSLASEARLAGIAPGRDARHSEAAAAKTAERIAGDQLTKAKTIRDAAESRLEKFQELRHESTCDRCGQPLTPDHLAEESNRLREESRRAADAAKSAERDHRTDAERLESALAALDLIRTELDAARRQADQAKVEWDRAEAASSHLEAGCADHHAVLAPAFQDRIAAGPPRDWLATTFPSPDDLGEGHRQQAEIAATQEALSQLKAELQEVAILKTRLCQETEALARTVLQPGDEEAEARREALAREYRSLEACSKTHNHEKKLAEQNRDRLGDREDELRGRRVEADRNLATESSRSDSLRGEELRAIAAAPADWRCDLKAPSGGRIDALEAEAKALREKGTEALAAELPKAQIEERQAATSIEAIDRKIAEIAGSSRLEAEPAASRTAAALDERDRADRARREAQSGLDELRRRRDHREQVAGESRSAESSYRVAQKLAELLGRDGVQRHLLGEAERGILDRANPILGEISGGELQLRLVVGQGDPNHALPIEAIVRTHGRTNVHDVAYLSASQKFRVAVSLALAIGQYARGKKERPIESVIIDEGFGSLDRQGRDEMIAQLNNLKGRLARIILVSHQEDFVDAFADSYRFEVIDRATVVEASHR